MMRFLYLGLVHLVEFLLPLIAKLTGSEKLKLFTEGRKQAFPQVPPKKSVRYWFHCASLGEFEQAVPVMQGLKAADSETQIIVTFFSPSGYEQRKKHPLADVVMYLPLDTPANAKKVLDVIQPDVAIFVKYEIWFYLLSELKKREIPFYLLSAVFRKDQYILSWMGKWLFDVLPNYEKIFLQDKQSFELLEKRGLNNITYTGDTRYDRVKQNALKVKENDVIAKFKGESKLLVLGSSWPTEEKIIHELWQSEKLGDFKIMIAPHDVSDSHITEIIDLFGFDQVERFTQFKSESKNILILDTIGHLSSAYFYSDVSFIGGAFGKGLHNILESLAFGSPVIFGPNYEKYPEAHTSMHAQVAMSVHNAENFIKAFKFFTENEECGPLQVKTKCIDFVNWNSGATEKVLKSILH
ncbi:MAG TPA: glycosyltransferase N-terminal domain-containing protein [Bacteroidia bacterium]